MMEPDAAPAGGARNPALGRPGEPPGGHYDPSAWSTLDWDWPKASSQEARTRRLCFWRKPEMRAAMERREAPVFLKRERGMTTKDAPLGAPSPRLVRGGSEGKTAYPAPLKNTGDFVRLL